MSIKHRTASILLDLSPETSAALSDLQKAYADACNLLVPVVQEQRLWNRVKLHQLTYTTLREQTQLGSQMCCNAIFSVCKTYRSQKALGRIKKDEPVPSVNFKCASVHFDKRTYTLKGNQLSLTTLEKRVKVVLRPGAHQQRILEAGIAKEAELIQRNGRWYFNLVVDSANDNSVASDQVIGIDVGENNLAAMSTGKVFGGEQLRDQRDRNLALRRRLQSNGSQSAKQKLRQVSGKEARHVTHINHETSKAIVLECQRVGAGKLVMEDLTHIRDRIKANRRMRGRLHRWAWRQLQTFIQYKAEAVGMTVVYVNPAYTSQTCSDCGSLGKRVKHRFVCLCGLRAHADLNASRNLARMDSGVPLSRAAVNTPDVGRLAFSQASQ